MNLAFALSQQNHMYFKNSSKTYVGYYVYVFNYYILDIQIYSQTSTDSYVAMGPILFALWPFNI